MLREEIRHLKTMEKLLAEGDVSQSSIYEKAFVQNQMIIAELTEKYGVTLKEYYEFSGDQPKETDHAFGKKRQSESGAQDSRRFPFIN